MKSIIPMAPKIYMHRGQFDKGFIILVKSFFMISTILLKKKSIHIKIKDTHEGV